MLTPVQKQLIEAVVGTYSLAIASDAISGVSYAQARAWLKDKEFKTAYDLAMEEARDRLLGALYAMAKGDGTDEGKGNPSAAATLIKMSGSSTENTTKETEKQPFDTEI